MTSSTNVLYNCKQNQISPGANESLWHLILTSIQNQISRVEGSFLPSAGVEVEFFLLDSKGIPASIELSQEFLKDVARQPNWKASIDRSQPELDVTAASRELGSGRYTKLKYEYPPHMLEVAFSYFYDINDLYNEILEVWSALYKSAKNTSCQILMAPFIDPNLVLEKSPTTKKIFDLNQSRKLYLQQKGIKADPELYLFPSFTAGTQVHIGGIDWWEAPQIIPRIYAREAAIPLFGSELAAGSPLSGVEILGRRVDLYRDCFPDMALSAFPTFSDWNLDRWLSEMLNAPLGVGAGPTLSGKSYQDLSKNEKPLLHTVLGSLRDLQFVRPRFLGTIEFRSDGAIESPEKIVALAAYRLAQAIDAANDNEEKINFNKIRNKWEKRRKQTKSTNDPEASLVMSSLLSILHKRKLGEEILLEAVL